MTRSLTALLILLALAGAAHAFGLGLGNRFGKLGAGGIAGTEATPTVCTTTGLKFNLPCNTQYLF